MEMGVLQVSFRYDPDHDLDNSSTPALGQKEQFAMRRKYRLTGSSSFPPLGE